MRILSVFKATHSGGFTHADAQRFELKSAKQTIRDAYPALLAQWREVKAQNGLWQSADDHWFRGDGPLFAQFVSHVRTRKCLEIGSGPFGFLAPCWWIADRVVIDPLFHEYEKFEIELCGESWLSGMRGLSVPAETAVEDLVGKIDGCIITRNCLDHCEDPLAVLDTISRYAAPGCWLLLWTDIWHLQGLDEGHHNITHSTSAMDALIAGLGFEVLQHSDNIRRNDEFLEYGCVARKITRLPAGA